MINFNSRALTIVEVLVTSAIIVVVLAGSLAFYLMARSAWIDCSERVPLQRKASLAMEKMVRGIDGRDGIREADAQTVVLTDSDSDGKNERIDFTDLSGSGRNFRLVGTEIKYDSSTDPLTTEVTDLAFSYPDFLAKPRWLRIELTMGKDVRGEWMYVNLRTDVKIRN